MKQIIKRLTLTIGITTIALMCSSCSAKEPPMPYSSSDYENGEWTVEEIVENLKELGFEEINVEKDESRYVSEEYIEVKVEDYASTSFFTEYKDFVAGEPLYNWRKVRIRQTKPIPVLTSKNCPELESYLKLRTGTDSEFEEFKTFMSEHVGEYIEFNGYITDIYDELWFAAGMTLTVSFEDNEDITFQWDEIEPRDLGYDNNYSSGCLPEGSPVHCVAKIVWEGNTIVFRKESIEVR